MKLRIGKLLKGQGQNILSLILANLVQTGAEAAIKAITKKPKEEIPEQKETPEE